MTMADRALEALILDASRWVLAAARVSGTIAALPGLGSRHIPLPAKVTVAFGIGLMTLPSFPTVTVAQPSLWTALLLREFLIGLLIGFSFGAFVWVLEWVAGLIDWQVGFGFATLIDPTLNTRSAVIARTLVLLATTLFFTLNGHYLAARVITESYRWVPLNITLTPRQALGAEWMAFVAKGLLIVLPFAVPAIGVVLLIDLILGLMGRAAPQFSVLLWGMPVRVGAAVFVIAGALIALPLLGENFLDHITRFIPKFLIRVR